MELPDVRLHYGIQTYWHAFVNYQRDSITVEDSSQAYSTHIGLPVPGACTEWSVAE